MTEGRGSGSKGSDLRDYSSCLRHGELSLDPELGQVLASLFIFSPHVGAEWQLHQTDVSREPEDVTDLSRKQGPCRGNQGSQVRSSWITPLGPTRSDKHSCKRKQDICREGTRPCGDRQERGGHKPRDV